MIFVLDPKNNQNSIKKIYQNAIEYARYLYREGQKVEFVIRKATTTRTGQQNRYFHALIGLYMDDQFGQQTPSERDKDMHFLKRDMAERVGLMLYQHNKEGVIVRADPMPTRFMEKDDFGLMIEAAQKICDFAGVRYPVPEEMGLKWK